MKGVDEDKAARWRRWLGALVASGVAYVMGQAFAYSPIEVYSDEEIMSVILPGLAPVSSDAIPAAR